MIIQKDVVVALEYEVKDNEGEILDTSAEEGPLVYLHGHEDVIPGLEKALLGKKVGDVVETTIQPEDGYGEHAPELVVEVPFSDLPEGFEPEIGMELTGDSPDGEGEVTFWVVDVTDKGVVMDANHPLAGEVLHFSVKVLDLRAATPEEIAQGHLDEEDDEDDME